jgi:methanogenic corrinoid protein MtbC1
MSTLGAQKVAEKVEVHARTACSRGEEGTPMSDGMTVDAGQQSPSLGRHFGATQSKAKAKAPPPADTLKQLAVLVESQIIPRLLAAERPSASGRNRNSFSAMVPRDIERFTELLLSDDMTAISEFIEAWRAKGVSVEAIYLELFTGAARHLGSLWEDDNCNFCEVGLAVWRIQQCMYELRPAFFAEGAAVAPTGYRVLLAPLAAEQHTLGVMMTAEFFRRAGWDVSSELPTRNDALVDVVRSEHIDLIGISVSSISAISELPATIAAVRRASKNQLLSVMVGGWMFRDNPGLVAAVGADFCVFDVRDGVIQGEKFVSRARATESALEDTDRSRVTTRRKSA